MKRIVIGVIALFLVSCAHAKGRTKGQVSDSFHWRPAANAVGWAVFLPGSSGLRSLADDGHYFNVAERLNRVGWSVLLVDYKPAFRASGIALAGSVGDKIAWVTQQSVDWLRREHPETRTQPGALVGWSLGAEGVLRIVNDGGKATALEIRAAVIYYPSNEDKLRMNNQIPVLVLSGEADDVIRAKDVEALVRDRPQSARLAELHLYPGAYHGFDVASLTTRKTVRLLPLVGPKATLQYDKAAAIDAERQLVSFLANNALTTR